MAEVVFGGGQERRTHPHPGRAERQRSGHLPYRCRCHRPPAPAPYHQAHQRFPATAPSSRSRRCDRRPRDPERRRCRHRSRRGAARAWRCPPAPRPERRASCAWSMTSFGGDPSALAINLIGCLSATSTCDRATECSQPSTPSLRSSSSGSGGTPRSARVLATKSRWLCGISLSMSTAVPSGRHLGGHHDVDAVRACRRCSRPSSTGRSRDRRRR